jgi:iron complex transport system substrate-binding protein
MLALLLLLGSLGRAGAEPPGRVVTVNLCLDQLALRLAAPGQLVGVSHLSHDPHLAVLADAARRLPAVWPRAESILALQPDLVVLGAGQHATLQGLLRLAGVRVLELPWAASLAEAAALARRLGDALGRSAEAEALAGELVAPARSAGGAAETAGRAVLLEPNGGTTGKGSLVDELFARAGYRNVAADLGIEGFGRLSLETVLAARPDLVVLDRESNADPARATSFVENRTLRYLAGQARVLSVPTRETICAGPESLAVVRRLREARP